MKRRLMPPSALDIAAADARDNYDEEKPPEMGPCRRRANPRHSPQAIRSAKSMLGFSQVGDNDDEGTTHASVSSKLSKYVRGIVGTKRLLFGCLFGVLVVVAANFSRRNELQNYLDGPPENREETYDNVNSVQYVVDESGKKSISHPPETYDNSNDVRNELQNYLNGPPEHRKETYGNVNLVQNMIDKSGKNSKSRISVGKSGRKKSRTFRALRPPSSVGASPSWSLPLPGVDHVSLSETPVTGVHPKIVIIDGVDIRIDATKDAFQFKSNDEIVEQRPDVLEISKSSTVVWDEDQECVLVSDWQKTFHPTCNSIHEMDTRESVSSDYLSILSSKGFWRDAWKLEVSRKHDLNSTVATKAQKSTKTSKRGGISNTVGISQQYAVFKSVKFSHDVNDETFELQRTDAVALDQLTSSRYVMNIYGFCGGSSLTEFAGGNLKTKVSEVPPDQKLLIATNISESIADVHAVDGEATGSLIHNDINMENILLGYRDGVEVPLLNDFNIAVFRRKDVKTGAACRFHGRFANPQWMSPQQMERPGDELSMEYLNEKVDVYALGNILYKIVVGHSPWKFDYGETKITKELKEKIARAKIRGGKPKLPPDVRNSTDPCIQAILFAMDRCYRNDPDVRPTAREIAQDLRIAYQEEYKAIIERTKSQRP